MTDRLEVSDIADSIKARISDIQGQLKDHKSLTDELERLQDALSRLEAGVRSRVGAGRRGRRPTTQRNRAAGRPKPQAAKSKRARAPRGENRAKILESLKGGPKTGSEIAKDTGIKIGSVGSTVGSMMKAGEVVKVERGYDLPK